MFQVNNRMILTHNIQNRNKNLGKNGYMQSTSIIHKLFTWAPILVLFIVLNS